MATNKQKALAKKLVENPRLSMGEAMREVGYSEASAIKPSEVTESKGWQELVEKMLPDEKVLLRHAEGLDATKEVLSHTEPDRTVPDYAVRKQYIELAYKVKGKLKDVPVPPLGGVEGNTIIFVNFKYETDR